MTTEEKLREAVADRLAAHADIGGKGVKVITRMRGDFASMIDEALAASGTAVIVTTPVPMGAVYKLPEVAYTGYTIAVMTIANASLEPDKPTDSEIAGSIEASLHQFAPPDVMLGARGEPWVIRLNGDQPRDDVSEDLLTSRLMSRFKYQPKGSA